MKAATVRITPGRVAPEVLAPMRTNRTSPDRFWSKVDFNCPVPEHRPELGPCWLWTGALTWGYGRFKDKLGERADVRAHRYVYEFCMGPIPEGLTLDHLCRVRHCQHPWHLEPVTQRVNTLRGVGPTAQRARQTHCIHGHLFDEANTYYRTPAAEGLRCCRACRRDGMRVIRAEKMEGLKHD